MTISPLDEILGQPPLREQLWRRFLAQPELPALFVDGPAPHGTGGWLTYGELGGRVNRAAHGLAEAGAVPGMRVGLMLPNG